MTFGSSTEEEEEGEGEDHTAGPGGIIYMITNTAWPALPWQPCSYM